LNEALEKMNVGERKTIEITPENAFGDRKPELIRLIPESRFKEQDIEARPGNIVNVNNIRGRIISVDGGRIRVDFNHPLAGKTLEYDLKITKEITDDKEKIQAIVYYFSSIEDVVVELKEDSAEISIKVDIPRNSKEIMANTILKWLKEIKKVIFKEEFENK